MCCALQCGSLTSSQGDILHSRQVAAAAPLDREKKKSAALLFFKFGTIYLPLFGVRGNKTS